MSFSHKIVKKIIIREQSEEKNSTEAAYTLDVVKKKKEFNFIRNIKKIYM